MGRKLPLRGARGRIPVPMTGVRHGPMRAGTLPGDPATLTLSRMRRVTAIAR